MIGSADGAPPVPGEARSVDEVSSSTERLDLVVLGATGFTGRLMVSRLALLEQRARAAGEEFPTWAVAGRDRERLRVIVESLPDLPSPPEVIADVDVHDTSSLHQLAARCRVLLNGVGPYSGTAEAVVAACVDTGTHYGDLSGELPLLRRVVDRFHESARAAGCQVVQLAGWEALPPDVAALHACRLAAGAEPGAWGPGASAPVRRLVIEVRLDKQRQPGEGSEAVSAGTLGSIVEIFSDPDARIVGDPAGLLPFTDGAAALAVRRDSPLRVRPFVAGGRLLGPLIPVAFLNPPALHRTAALLAALEVAPHRPARYREGVDRGPVQSFQTWRRLPSQALASAGQRGVVVATHLPLVVRKRIAATVRRRLPSAGTGPSAAGLGGWHWTVRADAESIDGGRGTATMSGTGHPGYTATAAMLVALGLHLANPHRELVVPGVVTPAVAFGPAVSPHLRTPELNLHVG